MAQDFSSREAKELLARHRELNRQQNELAALPERFRQESLKTARQLRSAHAFENAARDGILRGKDSGASLFGTDKLISDLSRYQKLRPIADYAKQMLDRHQQQVRESCDSLQAGGSGLRRIFSSSQKKQDAQQAYHELSALLNTNYATDTERMQADAARIMQEPSAAAWRQWQQDPASLKDAAREALKEIVESGVALSEITQLLQQFARLEAPFRDAESVQQQSRSAIVQAAKQMSAAEVFRVLQGVPVEEANRDKGGIRVKALRDSGFESMADIYAATPKQLADVKGISDDGAYELKKIAADFAYRTATSVKIKLSFDDQTPEATGMVCAVYRYLQAEDSLKDYRELAKGEEQRVSQAKKTLESVGNGTLWIFYSAGEKQEAQRSFRYLSGLLQGGYAAELGRCAAALNMQVSADPAAAWAHFSQNSVRYYNVLEELVPQLLSDGNRLFGLPEDLAHAIQAEPFNSEGLSCTLRRYQEWGVKYILHQKRVLLGDEMGLGKTVQAIAAMASLRNDGATHFAVVCPASVLTNWCREIAKHSDLSVIPVHGGSRQTALAQWVRDGGVAVTTYETTAHFELEDGFRFDMLVVDEAHYIKNAGARRTVNVKKLCERAERLLFMTGTAIENRVEEMLSLMTVLQPELAGQVKSKAFMASAPQFREEIAPVYYRRKREDVLTELPDLTESEEWCGLQGEEEQLYEQAVLSRKYADARRVSWAVGDLENSSKARRLKELLGEALEEERKVIVFSFFLDTIEKICAMLGDRCVGPINGSVSPQRRQELVDEFDKAPAGAVLAAQIQSGGTGLNIQSASVIVICEPQLKPSIENQAISRAYRMGQARNVLVYRLLCENTVDEKITEMLAEKQAVFDAFADKSAIADETMELDQQTLGTIIDEEIKRIQAKNGAADETPAPVQ